MTTDTLTGITLADRYRIDRLIGRGGMGVVYRAHHLLLDRTVAVKVLRSQFAADERAVGRFLREARAMARIEHPNAVSVHDSGSLPDGTAYLVMEYIEGESLRTLLGRSGPLPVAHAVLIADQVCGAVEAAHRQGVVHRDLKPENVMLKRAGAGFTVKVVDFGLAKIVSAAAEDGHHVTAAGEFFGTPAYMAPEFCQGETIDGRADIYAIGVLLYEMLSGVPPFQGTLESVLSGHLFQEPPAPTSTVGDIPPAVAEVIRRALRKPRGERPGSAAELAALLRAACPELSPDPLLLAPAGGVTLATDPYPTDAPTASSLSSLLTTPPKPISVSFGEHATQPGRPTVHSGPLDSIRLTGTPPIEGESLAAHLASRRSVFTRAAAVVVLLVLFGVLFAGFNGRVEENTPGSNEPALAPVSDGSAPNAAPAPPSASTAAPTEGGPESNTEPASKPARPRDASPSASASREIAEPKAGGAADPAARREKREVQKADVTREDAKKTKKRKWFDPRKWL
jgi:serine/threonine protein kinase